MQRVLTLLLLFFSFLYCFPAIEALQFEEQTIEKIDIIVHTNSGKIVDSQAILARMKTKASGRFSQTDFDNDLKTLSNDFDRIEPSVNHCDGQIAIQIDLWPKPVIREICWCGNEKVKTNRLRRELGINQGALFERQEFNRAFHKLKDYYTRKGFFEAEIDYRVLSDPDTCEVSIIVEIKEGRSGLIQDIKFVNFTEDEQHAVLKQIYTKKYNMLLSWYTQAGTYNPEAIEQDQLLVINYLQNEGYADALVNISVCTAKKTNRIIVTITADKGEQYHFGRISFEGNCVVSDEQIDRFFPIRPGCPFSMEKLRETVDALTDAYGKLGYIDAIVDFEPQLVEGSCQYDVHFKIEEGEQYYVGLIRVFGNISTKTSIILHEAILRPGEIFDTRKLKLTEMRLQNIGFFKNVNVYIVKGTESQLQGNYRDVYIEVEETNTGQFSAFLGYSSVDNLFGGITITERNFNQDGIVNAPRDGLCALRGGGEYMNFTAQLGQKSNNYSLSWTRPYFMDTPWSIGYDLMKSEVRYVSKDYGLNTLGLSLRAQYNLNQFVRFGLQYRLKNGVVNLRKHHVTEELWKESHIHGLISAVGGYIGYDSTNHPIRPSKGFRSKLQIEVAGLGGDHSFIGVAYLNTFYLPVGSRSVLKYRGDLRFIQPMGHTRYQTMPLDERLFLGGEYFLRGFRAYRVGPQFKHLHHQAPRGGLSLQFGSVEFVRKIIKDFEVFAFMDSGHLSKHTWEFGHLSTSVGFGTRFKIIESIPEVTMGMGFPVNARSDSEVKRFFITFGGYF